MARTIAGLLGTMGVLAATVPAPAAALAPVSVDAAMQATSYSDLLRPIPNALALMKAASVADDGAGLAGPAEGEATVQDAQFLQPYYHHHHHHHHHHYYRRPRYHHHHHHHHHHRDD